MSKFVGKFRKNQDYNEDYDYARKVLHSRKRINEHSEIKKLKSQEKKEHDLFDEYEDNE